MPSNGEAGRDAQVTAAESDNEKRPLIAERPFIGRPDSAKP
jgi:hypothetical protein